MVVDGNPGLGLRIGDNWRAAYYLRGSGNNKLVFGYTVVAADSDSDGISMGGGYQDSNGTWHNFINHTAVTGERSGATASRAYDGIGNQSGHKVDGGKQPVATSVWIDSSPPYDGTYRYGDRIDFAMIFSAELDVEGTKQVSLRVGATDSSGWRGARYRSGSGTDKLTFSYTVKAGDLDNDGVTLVGTWIEDGEIKGIGGSGTIKVKGTDTEVTPEFEGLPMSPATRLTESPTRRKSRSRPLRALRRTPTDVTRSSR